LCTRPTENGGSVMCDVLSGGPGMCDKVWQGGGRGSKLAKNSVTYFMDGPIHVVLYACNTFVCRVWFYTMVDRSSLSPGYFVSENTLFRDTGILASGNLGLGQWAIQLLFNRSVIFINPISIRGGLVLINTEHINLSKSSLHKSHFYFNQGSIIASIQQPLRKNP